jgi:AraC-like DNA-binding protein
MSSQCVPLFLRQAERAGADVEALMAQYGLPPQVRHAPEATMALRALWPLCEACAEAAGDPLLGFHVGTRLERGSYGLLEFSARAAADLGGALELLLRYSALLNHLVVFALEKQSSGRVVLTHGIPGVPEAVGRQCNEYTVGIMVALARELVGDDLMPVEVAVAHAHASALEQALRCPVRFGRGLNAVTFAAKDLKRPVRSHDPALLQVLELQAARVAAERPKQGASFTDQVLGLIREVLPHPGSVIERVAAKLHTTSRTVQRRLTAEGASFQELLEQVRSASAQHWVREGKRPLGEVAFLLGYSDLRDFVRAYKRWTGRTPGADREQHRA